MFTRWGVMTAVGLLFGGLTGCPGAQTKPEGEVNVKLLRVELGEASYDQMQLKVLVGVENSSANALVLEGGEVELEIVGKGRDDATRAEARDEDIARAEDEATEREGDDGEDAPVEEGQEEDEAEEPEEDDGSLIDSSADTSGIAGAKMSGRAPSSGTMPAFKRTEVPMNVEWKLPSGAPFERLLSWQRVVVRVKGTVRYGGKTATFGGLREIRAPNMPEVILRNAQVASEDNGAQGAAFFDIGIENPNPFVIKVDDFSYAVEVGGKVLRQMEGDKESVPPSSVQGFEDNFQMTQEEYGAELRKIMQQNTVPYRVWGKLTLRGISRDFEFTGDMQFPR